MLHCTVLQYLELVLLSGADQQFRKKKIEISLYHSTVTDPFFFYCKLPPLDPLAQIACIIIIEGIRYPREGGGGGGEGGVFLFLFKFRICVYVQDPPRTYSIPCKCDA